MKFFQKIRLILAVWIGIFSLFSCSTPSNLLDQRAVASQAPPTIQTGRYLIQPGDSLLIDFTHHVSLTRRVVVRPDGVITLPLLGDVFVQGRQPSELAEVLESRYSKDLKHPTLTVSLEDSPSRVVYVGGEVVSPGMFKLSSNKTVMQMVLEAGGNTENANLKKVFIVRESGGIRPQVMLVNLQGSSLKGFPEDAALQPRDIVIVAKSGVANANQFVDQYFNKLIPFSKSLGVSYFIGSGIE